jgi:peptide chain release factor 3
VKARKAARHDVGLDGDREAARHLGGSSVMQMEYRDCVINLLDTPGHKDFSEDTYRVLTAVDAALMVIDAANGVEPQTRRLLRSAARATRPSSPSSTRWTGPKCRSPLALMDEIERELGIERLVP